MNLRRCLASGEAAGAELRVYELGRGIIQQEDTGKERRVERERARGVTATATATSAQLIN